MENKKTLYSVPEISKMLGVTRQEIVRRIWRGFIKAEKVGNTYIVTKSEVRRLMDRKDGK